MRVPAQLSHPKHPPLPTDVEGFAPLAQLAVDLRSSWDHATGGVWRQLDPVRWELTHNPWVVLQTVSRDKLRRDLADPAFRKNIDDLLQSHRAAAAGLVSFADDGTALASPELGAAARTALGIDRAPRLPGLRDAHRANLAVHRVRHGFPEVSAVGHRRTGPICQGPVKRQDD